MIRRLADGVAPLLCLSLVLCHPRAAHAGRDLPALQPVVRDGRLPRRGGDGGDDGPSFEASCLQQLRAAPDDAAAVAEHCSIGGNSSGVAKGDFNGDGFADLAIGVPGKNTPASVENSGAVVVIYGSAGGLVAPTTTGGTPRVQFWSQNASGVPGTSEVGDFFGSALASGDFNGDGVSDLAIGVPGEDIRFNGTTFEDVGAVIVIYGSTTRGLNSSSTAVTHAQFFDFADGNRSDKFQDRVQLGSALAWGDFDGDGIGDLAIGAPGFTTFPLVGQSAGAVWILYGSAGTGLGGTGNQFFTESDTGVATSGIDDFFGDALAAGDFNGDGSSDLVIGMPNKGIQTGLFSGFRAAGQIVVMPGSKHSGLDPRGSQLREADIGPAPFAGLENDLNFGSALAAGDFDGDGRSDLAVGLRGATVNGKSKAGAVIVFHGQSQGLLSNFLSDPGTQFWTADAIHAASSAFASTSRSGDRFGSALAAGDFDGDGRADLAIGAPFKGVLVNGKTVAEAGEVDVLSGSATGLDATAHPPVAITLDTSGVPGDPVAGDHFGSSLTAWNFGRDQTLFLGLPARPVVFRTADLAIGAPDKAVGTAAHAGTVSVLYGSAVIVHGLTGTGSQLWAEGQTGMPTLAAAFDGFGSALY